MYMKASEQTAAEQLPDAKGRPAPASQQTNHAPGATHFLAPQSW
jgi:hypothetical protein